MRLQRRMEDINLPSACKSQVRLSSENL